MTAEDQSNRARIGEDACLTLLLLAVFLAGLSFGAALVLIALRMGFAP